MKIPLPLAGLFAVVLAGSLQDVPISRPGYGGEIVYHQDERATDDLNRLIWACLPDLSFCYDYPVRKSYDDVLEDLHMANYRVRVLSLSLRLQDLPRLHQYLSDMDRCRRRLDDPDDAAFVDRLHAMIARHAARFFDVTAMTNGIFKKRGREINEELIFPLFCQIFPASARSWAELEMYFAAFDLILSLSSNHEKRVLQVVDNPRFVTILENIFENPPSDGRNVPLLPPNPFETIPVTMEYLSQILPPKLPLFLMRSLKRFSHKDMQLYVTTFNRPRISWVACEHADGADTNKMYVDRLATEYIDMTPLQESIWQMKTVQLISQLSTSAATYWGMLTGYNHYALIVSNLETILNGEVFDRVGNLKRQLMALPLYMRKRVHKVFRDWNRDSSDNCCDSVVTDSLATELAYLIYREAIISKPPEGLVS